VNPCCCTQDEGCKPEACVGDCEHPCLPSCEWYAEDLYDEITAAFLNNLQIDMGTVNFRLAIPFQPFGWGCWAADETNTCCGQYECASGCGGLNTDTSRVDCFSAYNVSQVNDPQWRAYQYAPNQYFTACDTCGSAPVAGYLTYGLPPRNQVYPRCNDCSGIDALECVFTAQPMPDSYMIDENAELNYWNIEVPDEQPEDTGHDCCAVVPLSNCNDHPGTSFPYRSTLHFSTSTPGASDGFVLQQYAGSPTSCLEPADARDVYVRKELWVMPNMTGSGNCIRLVAKITYKHTFKPTIPELGIPGVYMPCTCSEVGRAWVGPYGTEPQTETSIAYYYVDIRNTDTFAAVKKLGMRLFRVAHSTIPPGSNRCGAEEGSLILNSNPGCELVTNPITGECFCLDRMEDACDNTSDIPYGDCPDWPSSEDEVPCTPRTSQIFPEPPPNTHFDFPNYIFFST